MLSTWACLMQDPATMSHPELQDCLVRLAPVTVLLAWVQMCAGAVLVLVGSVWLVARWRLRVLRRRQGRP